MIVLSGVIKIVYSTGLKAIANKEIRKSAWVSAPITEEGTFLQLAIILLCIVI